MGLQSRRSFGSDRDRRRQRLNLIAGTNPKRETLKMGKATSAKTETSPLALYECGPFRFTGTENYERHVVFDHAVSLEKAGERERFEAVARALRDLLTQRWLLTEQTYEHLNAKRVYYLSMEFLLGRTLIHNIINMGVD